MSNKALTLIIRHYFLLNTRAYSYLKALLSRVALYPVLYPIHQANNWLQ
jgi:hypothetical protein